MAWVRCCGGATKKTFTPIYTKSGWTQNVVNDALNGSGYGNWGTDGGYAQNVPVSVCTFSCNKNFTLNIVMPANGINGYVCVEVYIDGVLIDNTAKNTSITEKTLTVQANSGLCEIKINNWRGASSGTSTITFGAV